jgi:phosphoserine aminotransferase
VSDRAFNFSPGPATLPVSVLQTVRRDLVSLPGIGVSPLEISHRSPWFEGVIEEAVANLVQLLDVPQTHRVVFCQGGATMQFSMAPMNFLRGSGREAAYVVTGTWGTRAVAEARKEGDVRVVWDGADLTYDRVPPESEAEIPAEAAYAHITSNETVQGVQWQHPLAMPAGVPLVCDASSDFLSRPIDLGDVGLLYAGAQKNAGPAGVTVAIVRGDLLDRIPARLPSMLDYRTYVESGSLHNTPPVFAIWVLKLVTRWLIDEVGGLDKQLELNATKAALVYDEIDASGGFFRGHADPGSRSLMNVTFRLPTEELDRAFVAGAAAEGMIELRGHRSVGGIRASLYNAMPQAGARTLADFMRSFAAANG